MAGFKSSFVVRCLPPLPSRFQEAPLIDHLTILTLCFDDREPILVTYFNSRRALFRLSQVAFPGYLAKGGPEVHQGRSVEPPRTHNFPK